MHSIDMFIQDRRLIQAALAGLSAEVQALAFNNFHEGLHLGTILALRKFANDE